MEKWTVNSETFVLDKKYKVTQYLGSGAYGVVAAAYDTSTSTNVAIKKCKKIFYSRNIAKRTLRELRILRSLDHENIIKLKSLESIHESELLSFSEIYIIFEIMECDLATIIKSKQKLLDSHLQVFMIQIMSGLKYLHSSNVVHRDLKPRNILVNSNCKLKIADFGLSKVSTTENDGKIAPLTEYVTTRWYRAPEILVGWSKYSSPIDIWAAGCVLAELIGREPMLPGVDSVNQMELIIHKIGKPSTSFISKVKKHAYRQRLREYPYIAIKLEKLFPSAGENCIKLLQGLLTIDPDERMTALEATQHPYFKTLLTDEHNTYSNDKPPARFPAKDFIFEDRNSDVEELKEEILVEVLHYNPAHSPRISAIGSSLKSGDKFLSPSTICEPLSAHFTTSNCSSQGSDSEIKRSLSGSDNRRHTKRNIFEEIHHESSQIGGSTHAAQQQPKSIWSNIINMFKPSKKHIEQSLAGSKAIPPVKFSSTNREVDSEAKDQKY